MGQSPSHEVVKITEEAQLKLLGNAPTATCSEPLQCELEKQDIEGLDKLAQMDDENTKKLGLTTEKFYEYYNSLKQMSSVLEILDVPVFEDERAEIMKSFENDEEEEEEEEDAEEKDGEEKDKEEKDKERKEEDTGKYERREKALNNYSESVKEALDKIVRKAKTKPEELPVETNAKKKK
ncbi:hypothetical protein LSTR_LSTR014467 [Laodelphax striatellus]|uniref:Uncharacterized protein n=1 Tax=Laodelphax striatellus TaxID=195883 RepID=A0A482WRY6_LAOST|nr:hypothetical protein LSTR_LSTR014467 [Laodelphax striatellus]